MLVFTIFNADPLHLTYMYEMKSLSVKFAKLTFNLMPAYRGTGAKITHISDDWSEVKIKLPLNWRTRNYVGTIFGGSMYGAIDPVYMIMLMKMLGKGYIVWDKAALIQFKKPGLGTLRADFILTKEEVESIKNELQTKRSIERVYPVELKNEKGKVCAFFEKTIYIRVKE